MSQINVESTFVLYTTELGSGKEYEGRTKLGNKNPGDGPKYKGRGLIQVTGKDNYTRCGNAIGADFVNNPKLLLEPQYAALSAGWFWSANKCDQFADKKDIEGLTKRINGGLIGLANRKERFEKCLASF